MRVVVTDADYGELDIEKRALAGHQLVVAHCRTPAQVVDAARGADAVLVQYAPVTAEVVAALPRLRLISRYGVGVDGIDTDAARARGIWVCNVPDYGVTEVAAHAVALLLALLRNLPGHDRHVHAGRWDHRLGGRLRRPGELTLGVVGLGRIGRTALAGAAPWFGAIVGHDPYLPADRWPAGVERLDLPELFARSNAVTLHLPLTAGTEGLIGAELLHRMPAGSYLVNTSRGRLVDLDAVLAALREGRLAGVGLDVLPAEPPPAGHPLLAHPRALLTPHVAWYSDQAERDLRSKAAGNVASWAATGRPDYVVVPGR
ncbi:C-terminal binding protein [Actinoplanes sp. RD1]|uniref:C-terminal binding protein n=1 Tax=Actinoplanes sp. RD1 TaxID=3064538 RepID=UPI00274295C9|nr:C-terminal binding protein [Actinoplanes sp. RD1]